MTTVIRTPDQRLRVFVSSTLQELADERAAARDAIARLRLAPVMFELGARPHPPRDLYRAYLEQSHIFVGIYWQRYGWVAPEMDISGLEDEYRLSGQKPKLIYIKSPAPDREARLKELLSFIGSVAILIFFYVFPNGQFVPRLTRWLAILWIVEEALRYFFPDSPFNSNTWPVLLSRLGFVGFIGTGLVAQVYRYRRVSGPAQRQQTKWVVFGVAAGLGGFLGLDLLILTIPSLEQNLLILLVAGTAMLVFLLLIPLSIGLAILRSRLWDIDIIIRRTLIYGVLTGTLALVYFGSVVLLQGILRALTGQQQSPVVTVTSTLAIVALFAPLRRRVQDVIDRRLYRRKYDAAKTLAEFAETVRDEVDLNKLTERLMQVVEETMQPKSVSVWLRDAPRDAKPRGGERAQG